MAQSARRSPLHRLLYTADAAAEERGRLRGVVNNLILHLHPATVPARALRFTYTWGLGGASATLAVLLVLTGILLTFRYDASIDRAYASIRYLEAQTPFGSLVRAVHHWSANLLVVTVFLHLLRVFLTGGFKAGRKANWLAGILLLLVVLAFNFTGYLLPWDQISYWAVTVSTSLLGYLPYVGEPLGRYVLAGPEVGQAALRNFYALHVAVLPVTLAALLAYHFWKIRKSGGISQPPAPEEGTERMTTLPHLVNREAAMAAVVVLAVLVIAMLRPAPLGEHANPLQSPNPAKAAWYFLGLQELLLHMHSLAAIALVGIVLAGLALLPHWDRGEAGIGVYFRSPAGRLAALAGLVLAVQVIPILVVLDEFWIDLPGLLPGLPEWVSTGAIPLALSLAALALVYAGMRLLPKAGHSEALVGLVSFVFTALIVLTVIGIYFRGENMALVLPF